MIPSMKARKNVERRAASYDENPKIRGPPMHEILLNQMDIGGISNGFCFIKQKYFVLEKGSLNETPMTSFHTWHKHV